MQNDKQNKISLLLGAGFSAPMGYPLAKDLNNKIINLQAEPICVGPNGEVLEFQHGFTPHPNPSFSIHQPEYDFLKYFIRNYNKEVNGDFDYEVFFDVIVREIFDHKFEHLYKCNPNYKQYVGNMESIFTQIIEYLIKDDKGITWYESFSPDPTNYSKYKVFTEILKQWSKDSIINVHTLNHDLLFEAFSYNYLSGLISDGFSKEQSPYYGVTDNGKLLLENYVGCYDKPIRLFKLHGSLDYLVYKNINEHFIPENYVKIKYGVNKTELYKKKIDNNYEHYPFVYHSDFLTGKETKVKRYGDPVFYKKMVDRFKSNLQSSDKLIIIGYSGGDSEINKMIINNFNFKNKKAFIINRSLKSDLQTLQKQINAVFIKKTIESVTIKDFVL